MLVLKHVEYEIGSQDRLESLVAHIGETTSMVEGVTFRDIYFKKDETGFVLLLDCDSEEDYLSWRRICPPPPGAGDRHEVLLSRDERFPSKQ